MRITAVDTTHLLNDTSKVGSDVSIGTFSVQTHIHMRRRLFSTASKQLELPVLRLPSAILPSHHPVSLPILEPSVHERPLAGCVAPALADELQSTGRQLALLADGARCGVIVDLPATDTGASNGMLLHVMGGRRVQLLETLHRSRTGARFARFATLDDDVLSATDERALEDEAGVLRALLDHRNSVPIQPDDWELLLCTLDEELTVLPEDADPTSHPQFLSAARVPESSAIELGWWLAARMPLSTALRLHLLGLSCALKRTRDLVDAMRLLQNPAAEYARARATGGKMCITWVTAEASGCEVEPPRPVVGWAHGGEMGVSRY